MKEDTPGMNDQSVERIDPLTGVGNLLAFLETFTWRLAASEWTDFSLLLVDLNNFNAFNTEHGHAQGNAVLRWVSIAMKDLFPLLNDWNYFCKFVLQCPMLIAILLFIEI